METEQHTTDEHWINEEIKEEIKKYLHTRDSEDTTIQNIWTQQKAVLREST